MDFLKRWMDLFVADDAVDIAAVEDPFLRTYGRAADLITFHRRACVIRKRVRAHRLAGEPGRAAGAAARRRSPGHDQRAFRIARRHSRAHGYVDEGADIYTIQGLALESEVDALEYRVRFPDGTWSDWVGEGGFAGTRGQSLPVSGVCLRIAEALHDRYVLEVRGLFVGGVAVDVSAGEPCVALSGADLRGLQVNIRPAPPALADAVAL